MMLGIVKHHNIHGAKHAMQLFCMLNIPETSFARKVSTHLGVVLMEVTAKEIYAQLVKRLKHIIPLEHLQITSARKS